MTFLFKVLGGQRNNESRSTGGGKADRIKRPMNAFMVSTVLVYGWVQFKFGTIQSNSKTTLILIFGWVWDMVTQKYFLALGVGINLGYRVT